MHHSIILVILLILYIVRSNISTARQLLQVGWRIDADASSVLHDTLMMNLALVDTLITTATHISNLARRQALARHLLLRRVRHVAVHGLVDRRASLGVDVLAAEAQRIVGHVLVSARGLLRAAGYEARRLLFPVNATLGTIILQLLFFIAAALIHGLR